MRWLRGLGLLGGFVALLGAGVALAQDRRPMPPPGATPPGPTGSLEPLGPTGSLEPLPGAGDAATSGIPANEPPELGRLRALIGPAATLTYRTAEVSGDWLRLAGVELRGPDSLLAAETLALDRLRPDGLAAAEATGVTLTDADGVETAIGRVELRDLAVAVATPGETPRPDEVAFGLLRLEAVAVAGDQPVAIAEVLVEGYRPGEPGRASLTGLDVLMPGIGVADRLRIGRITLGGLDLPVTLAALADEETPPRPPADYALAVEAVALTLGERPVGSLGALRVSGVSREGGIDTDRLTLEALRVEPSPAVAGWLERLGYAALVGDFSAETRFDAAAGRLELVGLLLGVRDAAAFGLSVTLEGVSVAAAEEFDFENTRLVEFALRYLDQSLLGRLAAAEAKPGQRSERQVRDGWASQAAGALGGGGPVLAAVQRLLRGDAAQLDVIARPPEPVPVTELPDAMFGGATALQRRLGVSATAR